jgi:CMP-N-acetylneuraminic acid synthetase
MNSYSAPDGASTNRACTSSLPYDLGIIVPVREGSSQHLPDIYRVTNGLYMRDKESILREGYFLGPNPYKFPVSKVASVDIDVLEDFQIARSLRWLYEGAEQPAAV